jgi:hypothetical protein
LQDFLNVYDQQLRAGRVAKAVRIAELRAWEAEEKAREAEEKAQEAEQRAVQAERPSAEMVTRERLFPETLFSETANSKPPFFSMSGERSSKASSSSRTARPETRA